MLNGEEGMAAFDYRQAQEIRERFAARNIRYLFLASEDPETHSL
jgi:hypothetical protein